MSWGWRKILQVRHLVRPIFRSHIGNGNRTFAWHDHWSSLGPLSSVVSNRDIYSAGFHLNAKVSELTMFNTWKWPDSWYVKYPLLSNVPVPNFSDALDRVYLTNWSNIDVEFSVAEVWEALRPRNSELLMTLWSFLFPLLMKSIRFAAACYFIWQERNLRIFKKNRRTQVQIVELIKSNVRLKLLTCSFKKTQNVQMLMYLWKLPESLVRSPIQST
ncbi:hypothetical protein Tco_0912564 [Tanacetum coccineum]